VSSYALNTYRDVASTLTPAAVSQYLATQDWELEARQDHIKEIWRFPDGGPRARIMIPLATDYADFTQRFNDALLALGRIYDWDADELLERIVAARADLFFVRLDQVMTDGTIPFRQAETTIDAIYKMLQASATTAADPNHSHRGKRPARVTSFLDEDVRLGHTKRGSFVFTVATRLGDVSTDTVVEADQSPAHDMVRPFGRQVMETLARGLETTHHLTQGRGNSDVLDNPARFGLSAGFIESLERMTEPEDLRALDLSFEWAAAEPRPEIGASPIKLEHSVTGQLARIRERLVRREEPPRRETLVGSVRQLTREDEGASDDEEAGSIVIMADIQGRLRKVRMTLTGRDHQWAIVAYREKLPLTVTGDLAYERRAWRLTNAEVDSSFLSHHTGQDTPPTDRV
jgi:hypothetical protein